MDVSHGPLIALTFDDGPAEGTLEVLDVLRQEGVPATFFLVGDQIRKRPHVVKELAANLTVEIGSHSLSHIDLTKVSGETVIEQLNVNQQLLAEVSGRPVTLFRPPWGRHDHRVDVAARASGQSLILYTLDSKDWQHESTAETAARVTSGAVGGDIVLLHDTLPSTVSATKALVVGLKDRGFTLVTVSALLGPIRPGEAYDGLISKRTRLERRARTEAAAWRNRARRVVRGRAP